VIYHIPLHGIGWLFHLQIFQQEDLVLPLQNTPRSEPLSLKRRSSSIASEDGFGQSVRLHHFKMPLLGSEEEHEFFTDNPESLEGRLLFAVPKSESTTSKSTMHGTGLMDQLQRADCYNPRSISSKAQIYNSGVKTDLT
jgi:hypothetical protein